MKAAIWLWRLLRAHWDTFRSRAQENFVLGVEILEDRCVPASYEVTSLESNSAEGTLRWAIAQVNMESNNDPTNTTTLPATPFALTESRY